MVWSFGPLEVDEASLDVNLEVLGMQLSLLDAVILALAGITGSSLSGSPWVELHVLKHFLPSSWKISVLLASVLHLARWAPRLRIHQILRSGCCLCQWSASWSPAEFFSDLLFLLYLKNCKLFNFICNLFLPQLSFAVFSYIVLSFVLWSSDPFVITSDASTHPNLCEAVTGAWIFTMVQTNCRD